jgi:hypothetical protein
MRKLLFFSLLIWTGLTQPLIAQQDPNKLLIEEFLRQSEKQKKTGLIMLGTGLGATVIGTAMFGAAWGGGSEFVGVTGAILFTAGSISTLVSIPILVSSASNGRKAGKLSLVTGRIPNLPNTATSTGLYPAVSFSIPLTLNR